MAPRVADYHVSLGILLRELGKPDKARASLERALALEPGNVEATINLGNLELAAGAFDAAIAQYRAALDRAPGHAEASYNLAVALGRSGEHDAAEAACRELLARHPRHVRAAINLAHLLQAQGRHTEALQRFRHAAQVDPDGAFGAFAAGQALALEEQWHEAEQAFRKAVGRDPRLGDAHLGLASLLARQARHREALRAVAQAESCAANPATCGFVRAGIAKERGDVAQAVQLAVQAAALEPGNYRIAAFIAMASVYLDDDPAHLLAVHRDLDRNPPAVTDWTSVEPDPNRRLRVAYLSPDLRRHSVAFFIEPALARHDRERVEVFAYYTHWRRDAHTERLQGLVDHWVDAGTLNDEALAARIRADRIDILVDLAGHTDGARLGVLDRRAAPLQMTLLGYPNTTGMGSVDYRLTDWRADPPGSEDFSSERLLRLPGSYFCYRPPRRAPAVAVPPSLASGRITFGSFNLHVKYSDRVLACWARLLDDVPDARLLIKSGNLQNDEVREPLLRRMRAAGIDPARCELRGKVADLDAHLAMYHEVDIALDSFPYNGATTTCEALWMGVPVVSLAGRWPAARMGASILAAAGLEELVGEDADDYLRIARALATDPARLQMLRAGMRERLASSALLDELAFARGLEDLYRGAWRDWVAARPHAGAAIPRR